MNGDFRDPTLDTGNGHGGRDSVDGTNYGPKIQIGLGNTSDFDFLFY